MGIKQSMEQKQNIGLSPSAYQSLLCLQKPVYELYDYLQELSMSNPILEWEAPAQTTSLYRDMAEQPSMYAQQVFTETNEEYVDPISYVIQEKTFSEHLYEQLGEMKLVDDVLRGMCEYIIGCLDHRGYLDCPLEELAQETGYKEEALEQALYTVQMLDPWGVGARDLTECLILQLMHSTSFNALTVRIIKEGLDLLASQDYLALAKRFHAKYEDVERSAHVIYSLNPIPSRGFSGGDLVRYSIPEAKIEKDGADYRASLDTRLLPRVAISQDYVKMLEQVQDDEVKKYLKNKMTEARSLMESLQHRSQTLTAVIETILLRQKAFFDGGEIAPYTMHQMAEELGVNASTISRAVQDKTIEYRGKIIPLRIFFTKPIRNGSGKMTSVDKVKRQLEKFLQAEDSSQPLSDDALCNALEGIGITISRRTVAKYRAELGYDIASRRRKKI